MRIRNLSFSTRAIVGPSFEWAYELEDIGYSGWEMVQEGSQCLTPDNMGHVRDILETTGLQLSIHLPFSDMNLASLNPGILAEIMRQMKKHLELASGLAEIAVLHPGYLSPYGARLPDKCLQTSIRCIRELCDFAADQDMVIAVENMPHLPQIFGRQPDEMLDILGQVDRRNAGMTLDLGHANTMGLVDEFLGRCLDRVVHIHIHDNHGGHDEHLPLGEGSIDWKKVMEKLSGYKGMMVTEMSSLEEGAKCVEFLRSLRTG